MTTQLLDQLRRDNAVCSENEAHVQDIICALQKLDRANISLNVVIHANDLDMIPHSHLEELMNVFVIDRLNKIQQKLTNIQEAFDVLCVENISL